MKAILLSTILCLTLTTPGWAGHEPDVYSTYSDKGNDFTFTQAQLGRAIVMVARGWWEWPKPLTCEQQMQEAMRAMEPFIGTVFKRGTTVPQWDQANLQWDAAKACWKETK